MSEEHPNATAYRQAGDAFRAEDLGAFRATTREPGTSATATPC